MSDNEAYHNPANKGRPEMLDDAFIDELQAGFHIPDNPAKVRHLIERLAYCFAKRQRIINKQTDHIKDMQETINAQRDLLCQSDNAP